MFCTVVKGMIVFMVVMATVLCTVKAGNDYLYNGGDGNNVLLGGIGDDEYVVHSKTGVDTLEDNGGGNDTYDIFSNGSVSIKDNDASDDYLFRGTGSIGTHDLGHDGTDSYQC